MTPKSPQLRSLVAVALLSFGATLYAADSNLGTWKLNVAKSKFDPGPAPKSQTLKIEAWGADGVKFTSDGADGEGKPTHFEFQAKYDGTDVAVKGSPDFDMLAYKRTDEHTLEITNKRGGKVVGTGKAVVSKDGKTRTVTGALTNASGQKTTNVMVYDKQ
jgi:hypothetical protein